MKNAIFINYRSFDEPFAALLLDRFLTEQFGRGQVFRDSRTIRPGSYFPDRITQALQHCRALIAVIGPRWFARGPDGQCLIDSPRDYVRREIAVALERDILVVPVLVGEARLPAAGALPPEIAGLSSRQYLHLRVRTAESDVSELVSELAELLYGVGVRTLPGPATGPSWAGGPVYCHAPVEGRHPTFGNVYFLG